MKKLSWKNLITLYCHLRFTDLYFSLMNADLFVELSNRRLENGTCSPLFTALHKNLLLKVALCWTASMSGRWQTQRDSEGQRWIEKWMCCHLSKSGISTPCDITRGRLQNQKPTSEKSSAAGSAGKWFPNMAPSNQVLRLISLLAGEIKASGGNTSDLQSAGVSSPSVKSNFAASPDAH